MSLEQLLSDLKQHYPDSAFVAKLFSELQNEDSLITVSEGFCFYLSTIVKNFVMNSKRFEINEEVIQLELKIQREKRG